MPDPKQVKRNKETRGSILKTLEMTYPTPMLLESVQRDLPRYGVSGQTDIDAHVDYLKYKGYIVLTDADEKVFGDAGPMQLLKLTPKGIDLLEETITDAGVVI